MRPIPTMLLFAVLCACATPPRPLTPDGASRVPVNTPEAIERYRAQQTAPRAATADAASVRQIAELQQEIGRLRRLLAQSSATPAAAVADTLDIDGATVQRTSSGLLFRLPQRHGQAHCDVGPALHALLRDAALLSSRIEIRGRTDATVADNVNRRLAAQRAQCARQLLLAAGVDADKLHTSQRAAGGFIADNRSATGRARNRRIEIDMQGPALTAPTSFATLLGRTSP